MSTHNNHMQEEEKRLRDEEQISAQTNAETPSNEESAAETPSEQTTEEELNAEEKLVKELEEANKTIEDQKDNYLRLSAEFDNYRKRTLKEKAELIKNGGEKAINAILPILDDLERALQNMQQSDDIKAIYEGIELIYQKSLKNLSHEGLEQMKPIGEDFNTDYHEAIALVPATEDGQKGKILDCVQTGYKLNDKVIRHAKVVVAQ